MDVIVFESEAYKKLHEDMIQKMYAAIKEAREEALRNIDPAYDWINKNEAQKLLGLKGRFKLQELRDTDEIIFSKSGRTIMYSKKSILAYLERNIPKY